jgi:hypothetical protein
MFDKKLKEKVIELNMTISVLHNKIDSKENDIQELKNKIKGLVWLVENKEKCNSIKSEKNMIKIVDNFLTISSIYFNNWGYMTKKDFVSAIIGNRQKGKLINNLLNKII